MVAEEKSYEGWTIPDLLAARLGIDLGRAVAAKFDAVSARRGSPIRLGVGTHQDKTPRNVATVDELIELLREGRGIHRGPTQATCGVCGESWVWRLGEPERHSEGCLLAPRGA